MRLTLSPEPLAVCRLAPEAEIAPWMWTGPLASVTRTPAELSVICSPEAVPAGAKAEPGWRAMSVAGPLDFALTGVLAQLAQPLAEAGVPIFVLSTFDTDWLLVKGERLEEAAAVLRARGHEVVRSA